MRNPERLGDLAVADHWLQLSDARSDPFAFTRGSAAKSPLRKICEMLPRKICAGGASLPFPEFGSRQSGAGPRLDAARIIPAHDVHHKRTLRAS
jgi:hypothetical protein